MDYYAYRVAVRESLDLNNNILNFSILHHSGRLFQQYIIDAFCKIDGNNINYIRQNQAKLRVEKYSGLMDFVYNQANYHDCVPGKLAILPSTYIVKFFFIAFQILFNDLRKFNLFREVQETCNKIIRMRWHWCVNLENLTFS